jgi:hypothetical protein
LPPPGQGFHWSEDDTQASGWISKLDHVAIATVGGTATRKKTPPATSESSTAVTSKKRRNRSDSSPGTSPTKSPGNKKKKISKKSESPEKKTEKDVKDTPPPPAESKVSDIETPVARNTVTSMKAAAKGLRRNDDSDDEVKVKSDQGSKKEDSGSEVKQPHISQSDEEAVSDAGSNQQEDEAVTKPAGEDSD